MKRSLLFALALTAGLAAGLASAQQTTLRVFSGGPGQRPDLMRKLFDQYQQAHPAVKVVIETGGETSELQRQYLSTVLNAKDPAIDVFLIDIVNPSQYMGAGWIEPLDAYVGGTAVLKPYLPVYEQANVVNGKVAAMPAFADAMFLYYRKDLLAKYKIREPRTWDDIAAASKRITEGEKNANLQGLSVQGAPIEGTVCTFLLPYWSQGKVFNDPVTHTILDKKAATDGLKQWLSLVDNGVIRKDVAQVKTADTVRDFKAGNVVFGINWSFAWDRLKDDADTQVKDKVGIMPLPAVAGGKPATCVGGWQWAVSAFSKNKAESAKLVQFMASPASSKFLAMEGSLLPTYSNIYVDPEVTRRVPWMLGAGLAVGFGKSRPVSPRYAEVSDAIRTVTSAVLAGAKTPEDGVGEIETKLKWMVR